MGKSNAYWKRLLSLLLILIFCLQICPLGVQAEETTTAWGKTEELVAVVEPQIRAYAASINRSNADQAAAVDLAAHGMTGRGKTLKMGATSPMAATLMNSQVVLEGLPVIFVEAILAAQRLDMQPIPTLDLGFNWYSNEHDYSACTLIDSEEYPKNIDCPITGAPCKGKLNAYDNSLEWMVAGCGGNATIQCVADTGAERTYKMTVIFQDWFDFDTAKTSGFKKLISGIGAKLFREYDWNCTVTMNITIPVSYDHCSHTAGVYHWIYSREDRTMTSDDSGIYLQNDTNHYFRTPTKGVAQHYYELQKTVRLLHDKPWVLEYDVLRADAVVFSPLAKDGTKTYPIIRHTIKDIFVLSTREYAMAQNASGALERYHASHYFELKLLDLDTFDGKNTYTFRMENVINPDGSNMIYLTIADTQTGEVCLDRAPMDDHYYLGTWMQEREVVSKESDWLSGKDIYINYFGTSAVGFAARTFDLRIWENGKENPQASYWTQTQNTATCTETGYVVRTCSRCGKTEQDAAPALGHDFVNGNCTRCDEKEITPHIPGDINGDGAVNNKDATRLFQYLSGWDVEVDENALDVNGDGNVNNRDATVLFQYLSGWNVELF